MVPPIFWLRHVISANTIGFGEGEALQKLHNALPFPQRYHLLMKLYCIACRNENKETTISD
jgi:hypothetical protein